ncbi:MAG TPA: OsmC family protein [Candidatus Limnocylindrales bacterium]|nr:OsmC family protein [Candidatus Limnocylindrales bacterium]
MSDAYRISMVTVDGGPTALGSTATGGVTLVADRPVAGGGRGLGFNGGQLFYLAIAACVSNDLYREAAPMGITIRRVSIDVDGDFPGRGSASTAVDVAVSIEADADDAAIDALLAEVDRVAEIPASMRGTTSVRIYRA